MAKVFMTCGKICAGKSTYADKLRRERKAVLLSADEITLALFGQDAGEDHDMYAERVKAYLFEKSAEIAGTGIDVILDLGLWTRAERQYVREFFASKGTENEIHFIDIDDDEWKRRLEKRNKDVLEHKTEAYYVDEGLAQKFRSIFEPPSEDEIDVWIKQ